MNPKFLALLSLILGALLLISVDSGGAERVWKKVNPDGSVSYTNRPTEPSSAYEQRGDRSKSKRPKKKHAQRKTPRKGKASQSVKTKSVDPSAVKAPTRREDYDPNLLHLYGPEG